MKAQNLTYAMVRIAQNSAISHKWFDISIQSIHEVARRTDAQDIILYHKATTICKGAMGWIILLSGPHMVHGLVADTWSKV